MGKYITFDWFMKKLLRNKGNSVLYTVMSSVLFGTQIKIKKILESEGNKEFEDQKFNRVDLLVEDANGEMFIVQVQNDYEIDYFQRMLFGTSKVVTEYIKEGEDYGTIKKIYSVNIVYFALGQGKGYYYRGTTVFRNMNDKREVLKLSIFFSADSEGANHGRKSGTESSCERSGRSTTRSRSIRLKNISEMSHSHIY